MHTPGFLVFFSLSLLTAHLKGKSIVNHREGTVYFTVSSSDLSGTLGYIPISAVTARKTQKLYFI